VYLSAIILRPLLAPLAPGSSYGRALQHSCPQPVKGHILAAVRRGPGWPRARATAPPARGVLCAGLGTHRLNAKASLFVASYSY